MSPIVTACTPACIEPRGQIVMATFFCASFRRLSIIEQGMSQASGMR